jgi:SAM-dependent methyltransferase
MGFIVHGIERSQSMIDLGKHHHNIPKTLNAQSGGQFHCSLGDCTTDIVGNDFDLTLALFHVLSYQIKDNQVTDMLSNANRQLKNEGVFILDYLYAPALLEMGTEIRIKRASNEKLSVTRIAEPKSDSVKNRVDVNYLTFVEDLSSGIIRKIEECHKMRAFEPHEINDIADSCGFQVVKNEEWMTRAEPSNKTWGVCTILQKKSNC